MNGNFRGMMALAAVLLAGAQPVAAQQNGQLASTIELERLIPAGEGQPPVKSYVAPETVVPGDRIRVTLTFTNHGSAPASGINVTNPIADGLIFDGTADATDFSVSVDGGNSFGMLEAATLSVPDAAPRAATAADVTHVRWLWSDAVAPGQARSVAFFARVK